MRAWLCSRPARVMGNTLLLLFLLSLLLSLCAPISVTARGALRKAERVSLVQPGEILSISAQDQHLTLLSHCEMTVVSRWEDQLRLTVLYYQKLPFGLRLYDFGYLWKEAVPGDWGFCGPSNTRLDGRGGFQLHIPLYLLCDDPAVQSVELELHTGQQGGRRFRYILSAKREQEAFFALDWTPNNTVDAEHNAAFALVNNSNGELFYAEGLLRTFDAKGTLLEEKTLQMLGGESDGT